MNRPTASERRVVALAALSIPPRLLGLTLSLVREADARRDAWMDALDADASLPWDRDLTLDDVGLPLLAHAVCDGGLPSNAAVDPGEAA